MNLDSFGARSRLSVGDRSYEVFRLDAVVDDPRQLPYSVRVLVENLLRREDGSGVRILLTRINGRLLEEERHSAYRPVGVGLVLGAKSRLDDTYARLWFTPCRIMFRRGLRSTSPWGNPSNPKRGGEARPCAAAWLSGVVSLRT